MMMRMMRLSKPARMDDVQRQADAWGVPVVCTRNDVLLPLADYVPPPRWGSEAGEKIKFVRWPGVRWPRVPVETAP